MLEGADGRQIIKGNFYQVKNDGGSHSGKVIIVTHITRKSVFFQYTDNHPKKERYYGISDSKRLYTSEDVLFIGERENYL